MGTTYNTNTLGERRIFQDSKGYKSFDLQRSIYPFGYVLGIEYKIVCPCTIKGHEMDVAARMYGWVLVLPCDRWKQD